jgi:cytochrome c oxidase cbb3-type subunit 3
MAKAEIDKVSGVETTGHEWDGLKELNNPLPKWWLYLFYICIAYSIGYYVFYPSWPLISSYTQGILGYSQRQEALNDVAAGAAKRAEFGKGLETASFADIQSNPALLEFARANGRAAFANNCAPCHGAGAVGAVGYPNLQDDDWLWGGTVEAIHQTIQHGVRNESADARVGDMPAFGKDGVLNAAQISQVSDYVLALSDPAKAAENKDGAQVFADNCAACHGETGAGNPDLGAPNLTDAIWLFGGTKDAIAYSVINGRKGVMPAMGARLDPVTVKSLAVYVHSLGGGK